MKTKALILAVAIATLFASPSCSPTPESRQRQLEETLNERKQDFFDAIHPVGTARSIKLNSVTADSPYLDVRITVFWEGPITKDGYTKIAFRFDSEIDRITALEVEDTNGITKEDVGFAAGTILGAILSSD